jgi:vancomycin permeability regulator SanA
MAPDAKPGAGGRVARKTGRLRTVVRSAGGATALAAARGFALFVGVYSFANSVATALSSKQTQDLWWIDLRFLPAPVALGVGVTCAVVLIVYALAPKIAGRRRALTLVACLALSTAALQNVAIFYRAWGEGTFTPGVVFPFSLVMAALFALLGWAVWTMRPKKLVVGDHIAMISSVVVMAVLFPLAQVAFFGSSDYRARADAAVVFGARVMGDGSLSPSLRDRMRTAIELYRSGLVKRLVMSGGVGESGIDETVAMRDAAEKAGVPASAIVRDPKGVDTDATVRNTTAIFERRGMRRVLAVSQGYHLPRVKLAYLAAGWDVRTVPATEVVPIWGTPMFIAREVPAFWQYWARAFVRAVRGGRQ